MKRIRGVCFGQWRSCLFFIHIRYSCWTVPLPEWLSRRMRDPGRWYAAGIELYTSNAWFRFRSGGYLDASRRAEMQRSCL